MSNNRADGSRCATDVDRIVGANVKALRRSKKITQAALGEAIGLSFKQIRKYESGENRISASMLYRIAQRLDTSVERLFRGLELVEEAGPVSIGPEARQLGKFYSQITERTARLALLSLAKEISENPLYSA